MQDGLVLQRKATISMRPAESGHNNKAERYFSPWLIFPPHQATFHNLVECATTHPLTPPRSDFPFASCQQRSRVHLLNQPLA